MDGKRKVRTKKRGFKPALRRFKKAISNCIKNLKKMDRTSKRLLYLWGIIIFFVIVILIFGGAKSKNLKEYRQFEDKINEVALKYVSDKEIFPGSSDPLEIQIDALVSMGYLKDEDIFDKDCRGYAKIYYVESNEDYKVTSYLNCKKYVTEGYSTKK